jgi:dTDP-4-amino-4,6-dideoxygalactose transaminase
MAKHIPFFNYSALFEEAASDYMAVVRDVLQRGAFILQEDVEMFERNLAEFIGVRHVIGVGNCTDGLVLALRAANVGAGDEVIFPSHTFVATASAVHAVGATPVPVDCQDDHLIDPQAVAAAVTPKTRAIMPVQLNGRVCNMDALQDIADRHRLLIIEDAAQSLGARYQNRLAGGFGIAAAFSFYPAKILGGFGDGGAVVTNDDAVADRVRRGRDHGRAPDGTITGWGMNSRLDNLQAAVLNYRFRNYHEIIATRRQIAGWYHERLRDLPALTLPPPPDTAGEHFDVYQNYEIESDRRDALRARLQKSGIGTMIQWGGQPVHQIAALEFSQTLPITDRVFQRCLMLPLNTTVREDDVEYICGEIREFHAA